MNPVLCGDIGGTNCRLSLFDLDATVIEPLAEQTYSSQGAELQDLIRRFLDQSGLQPSAAALALAGPVQGRQCRTTNLPWEIDADALQWQVQIPRVELLNDLEAAAWGLDALSSEDLVSLQSGDPTARGNRAVIAAGTGLGQAICFFDGERHHPFATEGGHCDFAPTTPLEFELLQSLAGEFGHVSWERLVSGPGLENIHRFLLRRESNRVDEHLLERSADAIAQAASRGEERANLALTLMFRLLAAEAGNLALKAMARGGLYIAGGIAPKHLERLQGGDFLQHFLHRGRMSGLLQSMPVQVVTNPRLALLGPLEFLRVSD